MSSSKFDPRKLKTDPETALLVIDMQADFYSDGALAVEGGEEIVEPIAKVMKEFRTVVMSQDSHPRHHISFASSYEGHKPLEMMTEKAVQNGDFRSEHFSQDDILSYLKNVSGGTQVLWPDHCVRDTDNWKLDPALPLAEADLIIRKGCSSKVDSYSAFFENDGSSTGLGVALRARGIKRVVCVGLAGDYCVYWTAKDALRESLEVYYDQELTRFVNFPEKSRESALEDLERRGVNFVSLL